jgi:hypothetical protein
MRMLVSLLLCILMAGCSYPQHSLPASSNDYLQMSNARLCSHKLDTNRSVRAARAQRGLVC